MAKQNNSQYGKYGRGNTRPQTTIDKNFYNPYAFVPLAEDVYLLDKNEKEELRNLHDIPFEKGWSGRIKINFETASPLCVRYSDGGNVNVNGAYFVPGSSVKGMIRSVFEIITKSNFRNGTANSRYSMRDLRSRDYELKSNEKPQRSGFLVLLNNNLFVIECHSEPWKYKDIESEEGVVGLKDCKSVADKYRKLESHIIEYEDESYSMWFFSGFMQNKEHEFLFDVPRQISMDKMIPLEEEEYQDFRFIHEKETDNASWRFWKKKLRNYSSIESMKEDGYKGIIPCFFRSYMKDGKRCVQDLGFSFLYRQPYSKRIHDFLPPKHIEGGIDFAQSVFGYVDKNEALKGRVQFSNAFINNPKFESEQTFILGSPKPTFYPFYIKQENMGRLETYFSSTANLAGYKRYLIHKKHQEGKVAPSKVTTTFRPLAAGVGFTTMVSFHNLRDYELGALLAAITFCMRQNSCYHSLGFAKPYGYGKLKVKDVTLDTTEGANDAQTFYLTFLDKMCQKLGINSHDAFLAKLSPLFVLSEGNYQEKPIRYPNMDHKEFNSIKNAKNSLKDFSPIK